MSSCIHSYIIDNDIRVDVEQMVVARIFSSRKANYYSAEAVFLGETAMKLFTFLLERSRQHVVLYDDILDEVWDKRGLISSYKRLSQVMIELKAKLEEIGLADDFIRTVRGKGYRVKKTDIMPLYSMPKINESDTVGNTASKQ
ncbi:hypothetical protein C9426_04940 [Serratia sp. S1B]|nr:hypothetical protein C9426_04940 [Serratia sp. S1B]